MVDIKEQKEFELFSEEKDIVVASNPNHALAKEINNLLGNVFDTIKEPFTTIHTLGKLKAKRVHIVNFGKLMCNCKKTEIYKNIAQIKENVVVLVDTFQTDK